VAALNVDKIPPGPDLDALVAERVFGWKNVHRHQGGLYRKKQDRLRRWRTALKTLRVYRKPHFIADTGSKAYPVVLHLALVLALASITEQPVRKIKAISTFFMVTS
jgi:hypothetical protein